MGIQRCGTSAQLSVFATVLTRVTVVLCHSTVDVRNLHTEVSKSDDIAWEPVTYVVNLKNSQRFTSFVLSDTSFCHFKNVTE